MTPAGARFTTLGIVALVFITLLLAAGVATGKFVLYVLAVLILLVLLVQYRRASQVFFVGG
ncbi:hypothetical protein [Thiomonas sp.]